MDTDLLAALLEAGAWIEARTSCGDQRYFIESVQEARAYLENEYAFVAAKHGVTEQDVRDWMACEGSAGCNGRTAKGKPCKNLAIGGYRLGLSEYVRFRASGGGYCRLHGD